MTAQSKEEIKLDQGSVNWKALRKTKITSTDSSVIMHANPYKTLLQLYLEKTSDYEQPVNAAMQRGKDLEPIARDLLKVTTGIEFEVKTFVKNWQMASLDGISPDGKLICEIKCPGAKTHAIAKDKRIPDIYYPQIQHQMHVCDAEKCMYVSFDGVEIYIVECERDDEYIKKMCDEELEFYQMLINKIPPEEYINKTDNLWMMYAENYQIVSKTIQGLEEQQKLYREALISLANGENSQGGGVKLKKIKRKGAVDLDAIAKLTDLDVTKYRKPDTETWRIEYEKDRADLSSHSTKNGTYESAW